jgi:adenylate kinase family enzyme
MERIIVIGNCGAGKTIFSKKLNEILKLNLIHLDPLFYQNADKLPTPQEWEELINNLIKEDKWIIDGNYPSTIKIRLKRADTVIFLDTPRYKSVWNITQRFFINKFGLIPKETPTNSKFRYLFQTYKRVCRMNRKRKGKYYKDLNHLDKQKLFVFKSQKQSQIFLDNLKIDKI